MTIQHYTGACIELKGDGIRLLLQTSWILDNPLVTAKTFGEMPMPTGSLANNAVFRCQGEL